MAAGELAGGAAVEVAAVEGAVAGVDVAVVVVLALLVADL